MRLAATTSTLHYGAVATVVRGGLTARTTQNLLYVILHNTERIQASMIDYMKCVVSCQSSVQARENTPSTSHTVQHDEQPRERTNRPNTFCDSYTPQDHGQPACFPTPLTKKYRDTTAAPRAADNDNSRHFPSPEEKEMRRSRSTTLAKSVPRSSLPPNLPEISPSLPSLTLPGPCREYTCM